MRSTTRAAWRRCYAAAALFSGASVGVLITDAEELALAGARAWARSRPPGVALNCDSVDDDGELTVMYYAVDGRSGSSALAVVRAARNVALTVRRLLPGILTDSVALADARLGDADTEPRHSAYASEDPHVARHLGDDARSGDRGAARVILPNRVSELGVTHGGLLLVAAIVARPPDDPVRDAAGRSSSFGGALCYYLLVPGGAHRSRHGES